MPEPLTIAVAQPVCVALDVAANAAAHAAAVRNAAARVVIFPELSLSGYELDAPAISGTDARLQPIVAACAATGSVALVGAPLVGAERPYIAMLSITAAGAAIAYRKMWLGAAEAERFVAGSEPAVLTVDGWRLGLAICKDTGTPQHAADTAVRGMDVYVAGTVKHAGEGEVQDERSRRVARGHHVWVAVASFAGPTGGGFAQTAGGSAIWSPEGIAVARAGPAAGEIVRATLR
jgi:predicted amidohydrolase